MHTQALSDRLLPTADAGLQATFSCVFQSISWLVPPYEQHTLVHDKISLCFLRLTDLSIHKHRKTQASWVSATDSYGEKSLPALQLHFARHQNHVFANNLLCWRLWGMKVWTHRWNLSFCHHFCGHLYLMQLLH